MEKWQKVWKNRITHYTPRVKPEHALPCRVIADDETKGIIEKWSTKKGKGGVSDHYREDVSQLFSPDIVALYVDYTSANTAHNPTAHIKSAEDAEALQQLLALPIHGWL